jgi:hypothetical protein
MYIVLAGCYFTLNAYFNIKVRTHPVTLLKSLNYNPSFVDRIEQLNAQESHHILAFLREHLLQAEDLTVRWKWTPGSVAFWDNRCVVHRAIPGGYDVTLREGTRTAIFGERPFFDPKKSESLSERMQRLKLNESAHENGETNGASKVDGLAEVGGLAKADDVTKGETQNKFVLNN